MVSIIVQSFILRCHDILQHYPPTQARQLNPCLFEMLRAVWCRHALTTLCRDCDPRAVPSSTVTLWCDGCRGCLVALHLQCDMRFMYHPTVQQCTRSVPRHDRIAPGSEASEERATEDRKEVAEVHRHNSQHAEKGVSCELNWGRARGKKTYSKYPTPAITVSMTALTGSTENLQGRA